MLNLLTKTKPWIVASLFAATFLFGQTNQAAGDQPYPAQKQQAQSCAPCPAPCPPKPCCPKPDCAPCPPKAYCPQPCPPTQLCPPCPAVCCPAWPVPILNAAYNYPARIETRCPWGVWFDASFIWWQPIQENMDAVTGISVTPPTATTGSSIDVRVVGMDFDYKPGFRVGMGFNLDYDNWDVGAEYTWFHNNQSRSGSGGSFSPLQLDVFAAADFASATSATLVGASAFNQKWHLGMDLIDVFSGRWYYVGRKLVFHPYVGARGAFFRHRLSDTYTITAFTTATGGTSLGSTSAVAKSKSWGVGPIFGIDMNWNVGCGFRVYGDAMGDILFTRYRVSRNSTTTSTVPFTSGDLTAFTTTSDTVSLSSRRINTLRTHLDAEIGFGWGFYFDCNNWYMDFAVGYEWQVFFDQHMFFTQPDGNLYIHGANFKVRLDF